MSDRHVSDRHASDGLVADGRERDGADLAALHADWRAAWGPTIGGEALRGVMEGNPRLHERMLAAIARRHELSLARAPRLDRTGAAVAAALRADAGGFVRLCGLARIGNRLALATNPDDYGALSRTFGRARLVAAARIASGMPPDDAGHGYDSEQLGPAVDRMGAAVLREWASALPRSSAEWIAMHMPREDDDPVGSVGAERARRIVEGAVRSWPELREGAGRGDGRPALSARRGRAA